MVFNSDVFLLAFLPLVYLAFWAVRSKQSRYVLLTAAGYVFYGWWDWRFCLLLLFSSLLSFGAGLAIMSAPSPRQSRWWMIGAVTVDLSLLFFFKYFNFFSGNVRAAWPSVPLPVLEVALPVGISFYTFHTISYVVDVYAGRVRATRNLWEYLTYVNLFFQLVAGPIVRFRQIEDDLDHIDGPPQTGWTARGIAIFVAGLLKKVVIADHLGTIVDPLLKQPHLSFLDAWTAALGYTGQLYFDFSGYSDMALGLGLLFGLRIPRNFNSPYRAAGIQDFWHRWHISLSTWLRDYLYIPLGGSRGGTFRTQGNLMLTMVLGGLWHGANWTFVIWGGYHGLLLIMDRQGGSFFSNWPRPLYQLQTFILVVIGWVLFRSDNLPMAGRWLSAMFQPDNAGSFAPRAAAWLAVAAAWVLLVPESWEIKFPTTLRWAPVYAAGLLLAYYYINGTESVFLYFQF